MTIIIYIHVHIEKEKDHRLARGTQKAIAAKREEIQRTLVKGKSKVQTPLWKRFEESYKLDLEVNACSTT